MLPERMTKSGLEVRIKYRIRFGSKRAATNGVSVKEQIFLCLGFTDMIRTDVTVVYSCGADWSSSGLPLHFSMKSRSGSAYPRPNPPLLLC